MFELSPEEAEIVAAEASAAAGVLEGSRKEQALDLARAAGSGQVPDDLVTALDRVLERVPAGWAGPSPV